MKDFNYYTPTQVVFGRDSEEKAGELVKKYKGSKVLVHYGGKSAEKSGLLDKICSVLKSEGIDYVKLGGVVPNPRLSMVRKGIELCRKEGVDFILAIGGGSVIDSSKAISIGVPYSGDVWDFYSGKAEPEKALPIAAVLTIPAAGSEMSDSSVITNEENNLKIGYSNDIYRCKFAIMNPERTYSLPAYQTACGAVDIMMHTMERYFTNDDMAITDAIAEGLMCVVKECIFEVLKDPENYYYRTQIMWAGSLAHNDLTGSRKIGDWATHKIEHELSAMFDVAHGAGLSAVWGSWARYVYKENIPRFAKFAVNVMGVTNDFKSPENTALKGIAALEDFYRSIGMPVNIHGLTGRDITDKQIIEMAEKCSHNGKITVGGLKKLGYKDIEAIYNMAK